MALTNLPEVGLKVDAELDSHQPRFLHIVLIHAGVRLPGYLSYVNDLKFASTASWTSEHMFANYFCQIQPRDPDRKPRSPPPGCVLRGGSRTCPSAASNRSRRRRRSVGCRSWPYPWLLIRGTYDSTGREVIFEPRTDPPKFVLSPT